MNDPNLINAIEQVGKNVDALIVLVIILTIFTTGVIWSASDDICKAIKRLE